MIRQSNNCTTPPLIKEIWERTITSEEKHSQKRLQVFNEIPLEATQHLQSKDNMLTHLQANNEGNKLQ